MTKQVYYKSDFSAILSFDGGWLTPFKLKFWTNSPSRSFIASYDGTTYTNCSVLDDGRLLIAFDSHNMGLGTLTLQPEFYLTAEEYADGVCNEVITPYAPTFTDDEGNDYTLALSLTGSSTLETIGTLPAYYQKGDPGEDGAITEDAPSDGKQYARKDGTWAEVEGSGSTGTIDTEMSETSTNAVQNCVITEYVQKLVANRMNIVNATADSFVSDIFNNIRPIVIWYKSDDDEDGDIVLIPRLTSSNSNGLLYYKQDDEGDGWQVCTKDVRTSGMTMAVYVAEVEKYLVPLTDISQITQISTEISDIQNEIGDVETILATING